MAHILVVYATSEGQTRKVADRVASRVRAAGHDVTLVDARAAAATELGTFDAAVLAASLHVRKHQPEIVEFVRKQRARLERVPTAFISVSLSASSSEQHDLANARAAVDEMFDVVDWDASLVHLAAGAVHDRRMNFLKRWMIHRILREKGVEMDPSGDMEFTDWQALDVFVDTFLERCRQSAGAVA
ncbi:flavodoxin domain-containing protein [Stappia sp. ES.058]|uniref:flavodoxin domain-containing protein n=1 Tax=Stappia sp. ES.058 TaxID=1881061 RepID=UPI00087C1EC0|nr:flavodoxin domain-containing protein [Stappia sp. ES.058]SDT92492.1 menaquinone-dependent protoporphyrinogen oxidase [Stappia sp. ES.058]